MKNAPTKVSPKQRLELVRKNMLPREERYLDKIVLVQAKTLTNTLNVLLALDVLETAKITAVDGDDVSVEAGGRSLTLSRATLDRLAEREFLTMDREGPSVGLTELGRCMLRAGLAVAYLDSKLTS